MRRSVVAAVLLVPLLLLGWYFLRCWLSPTVKARPGVTLVGVGTLPHEPSSSLGSAIAYTGHRDEYLIASDSGPKGGTFQCRFHRMKIHVAPGEKEPVTLTLTDPILLTAEDGTPFFGSPEHAKTKKALPLDPEGVRVGRGGEIFVSDEYGPFVYQFDAGGKFVKSFAVPVHFRFEKGKRGRQENRGMEGLAISPDGTKLYGAMQSPLIQDGGGVVGKGRRAGVNCRILEIDIKHGPTGEFVYQLDDPDNSVCEILAVSDTAFLVLERDARVGEKAAFKKVFRIDLANATNVSKETDLPAGELPAAITPVKKTLFLDLLAGEYGIAGADCPEKFEGLAFGPDLPDGRHLLLVTTDNDFGARQPQPFRVYAFAIDRGAQPEK